MLLRIACTPIIKFYVKLSGKDYKISGDATGIFVNDKEHTFYEFMSLRIRKASDSMFEIRALSLGIDVIWGVRTGLLILVDAQYKNTLVGLAGNFDGSATNEYTSPQGSLETSACAFSNCWAMSPVCHDIEIQIVDPCDAASEAIKAQVGFVFCD